MKSFYTQAQQGQAMKYLYDVTRDVFVFTSTNMSEHNRRVALSKAECVVEDAERNARLIKQQKEDPCHHACRQLS